MSVDRDEAAARDEACEIATNPRMRYCLNVHGDMLCDGPHGHDGGCTFTAGWMLARRLEGELVPMVGWGYVC